jgi:nitrogen fixation protein NifU and related proteins
MKPHMNHDEFDDLVNDLQTQVDEQDREDFSEHALKLGENPYKRKPLPPSDTVIQESWRGPCGDTMTIYLDIQNGKIANISYGVDGCTASSIAGSQLVMVAENMTVAEARALKDKDVLEKLGKFPSENHHCALLAVKTLHKTLDKYEKSLENKSE